MDAPTSNSCDQEPQASGARWWQRLEEKWNKIQVGHQGSYSVERLESFDYYYNTTSRTHVALVCLLTPLPAVLVPILLDCLPLQPPSESSWTANWAYWIRLGLATFATFLAGSSQIDVMIPELNYTFPKRLIVCVGASAAYVATFMVGSILVGFPVPFTWYIGGLFSAVYTTTMMFSVFGLKLFMSSSPCRTNLVQFFRYYQAFVNLLIIFPLYKVFYGFVPVGYRSLVVVVLPIWRLGAKRFLVASIREMEDFIPEIVAFTVDFFSALFVSVCMSTKGSTYLSMIFIALDLLQIAIDVRDVRMNVQPSGINPGVEQSEKLAMLRAVYKDSGSFPQTRSKRSSRPSMWPHRRIRVESAKILPTPSSAIIPETNPTVEVIRQVISSRQPPLRTAAVGLTSKKLVHQGLHLMFHCEYLILIEYVECIVPLIYLVYKTALEHLPNAEFYPGGAGHFGSVAAINILVFAGVEIVSLLLLHIILERKLFFPPLYQLAFVLETQFYMVQTHLLIESIFVLQCELEHYVWLPLYMPRSRFHASIQMATSKQAVYLLVRRAFDSFWRSNISMKSWGKLCTN